jgi:hypothetical protein
MAFVVSAAATAASIAAFGIAGGVAGGTAAVTAATIGSVVGGGLAAGAVGAGLGAITSAATGQDIGKGALMGGIGGVVTGGMASGLSAGLGAAASGTGASTAIGAASGAAGGAAGAAAGGEDPLKGAALGGAAGGIGGYMKGADVVGAGETAGSTTGSTTSEIAPAAGTASKGIPLAEQASLSNATPFIDELPAGGITSIGPDMTPTELSSAINTPTASTELGMGSMGSNTAAINAVNATPPVAGPTPSTPSLSGYIDKGIKLIKDNPAVAIQAGGALLASAGGSDQQEAPPETVYPYTPSTYTPPPIEKTSVPQYYNPTGSYGYTGGYAEGGVINSAQPNGIMNNTPPNGIMNNTPPNGFMNNTQPNGAMNGAQPNGAMNGAQPNGPMNPIVARAMEQVKLQQTQQGQQSQIPPTQPPTIQGVMGSQTQPQFIVMPQQQQQQPMGQPMGQPIGQFTQPPMGQPAGENVSQPTQMAAHGGMMRDNLGGYSHGGIAGLTRGPGDGVSDSIPAQIGDSGKQPARLADGEFVVPSRIVSELGNGSTEAGAKALQAMVDRIQTRRSKTVGKGKVAVNSRARKELA